MHITLHTKFLIHTFIYSITEKLHLVLLFYISKNDKLKRRIRINLNSIYMGIYSLYRFYFLLGFIELASFHFHQLSHR